MRKRTKDRLFGALRGLLLPVLALAAALCFFTGISNLQSGSGDQGRRQLEDSIRRSAVACYAAEGVYPPSVDYLREHYGLQVDESRYYVDYRIFASNLMPTFTVLERSAPARPEGR